MLMTHKCRNCGHTVNDAQLDAHIS